MSTVAESFRSTSAALARALGSDAEGESAARIIFEDVAGYDRKYLFVNGDRSITDFMQERIDAVVAKVASGEPVQYAVGSAHFMGNDYAVDSSVLIPRPETAGLVDLITGLYAGRSDLHVLDVGTGSGCIAISLARALPFASVEAVDISAAALSVAEGNARKLGAKVAFTQCDILKTAVPSAPTFDIVVSNPPYICASERAEMDARVLDYEPAQALFVPDDDPLLFYRAIARYTMGALRSGGRLFFEINERFPKEMRGLLEAEGYSDIDVQRDYRGKYRFAIALRP
ncbi:MAG: peptide chain release factor N(5)-glutamine methyltransferase [Muribaculaceae bacterium]|nr:peptide chain release factor N(5)-glutamine methyltransferase [Muribaculaceae bacterium]